MTTPATLPTGGAPPAQYITVRAVAAIVAADYDIPLSLLVGTSRVGELIEPRQVAMWLGMHHLGQSSSRVGRAIGGRDHATILYGARKIEDARKADAGLAGRLSRLIERVDAAEAGLVLRAEEARAVVLAPPPQAAEPATTEPAVQTVVHAVAPSPRERRVCEAAGRFLQAHNRLQRSLYTPGERAARQDTTDALESLREAYGATAVDAGGGGR